MFLPDDVYATIESSMPIVCVDFVLVRRCADGRVAELGLIERESPFGRVWCHLGGRVRRGETIVQAIRRHVEESLTGVRIDIGDDTQPQHVYQWFPDDLAPAPTFDFGRDSRKHAIGLSFALDVIGDPEVVAGGEAISFAFTPPDALPRPLWPGCEALLGHLL